MLKETIVTGATIDEAVENGCAVFGMSRDDVSIEVLEYPQKKTFGLFGGIPAKVRVYFDDGIEEEAPAEEIIPEKKREKKAEIKPERPQREEKRQSDKDVEDTVQTSDEDERVLVPLDEAELGSSHQAVVAANYLRSVLKEMNLGGVVVEIMAEEGKTGAVLNLTGNGLGSVIGRRGETLSALQYLVSLAANNGDDDYFRISINIGNYREKREMALEALAKKTASRSLKISRNLALEPMNPFERRIVHTAIQGIEGVTSWSVDEGARRHVVIGPVGMNEGEDGLPVNFNRKRRSGGGRGYDRSGSYDHSGGYGSRGRGNYQNRGRGYNRSGGYNSRGGNDIRTRQGAYSRGGYQSRQNSSAPVNTTPRRDTSAPLYGRIEVPKRDNNENSEN